MKIRTGFVSNSSSSSFCLLGTTFEKDEFVKQIKDLILAKDPDFDTEDEYEMIEEWGRINKGTIPRITFQIDWDNDLVHVGIDPTDIPDDTTIGELKKIIHKVISDITDTEEDSWKVEWVQGEISC